MTADIVEKVRLLPCPFCGGDAVRYEVTSYAGEVTWRDGLGSPAPIYHTEEGVECKRCLVKMRETWPENVTQRWNTRAALEAKQHADTVTLPASTKVCTEICQLAAASKSKQPTDGVHLSHCNQGEYEGSCKYGDPACPAFKPTTTDKAEALEWVRKNAPYKVYDALTSAPSVPDALKTAWELSTWAACINWGGGENQKEWLDDLRILIGKFQSEYKAMLAAAQTPPEVK